jgi:hypothetical protein
VSDNLLYGTEAIAGHGFFSRQRLVNSYATAI